ncbi:U-box domain-containing protein 33-like [Raphanus sativus]|uniref:RING-type E3 ubiquitin transferase n=1 Tax=Raphanus sativus TaxID=3726 RepID=A0A6J0N3X3_RAPSA|nr:U-box domain-containing protein 33-like [Raphanus sativus]
MEEEAAAATSQILEEKIYVAVGREVWKNISNLMWALENSQGKKICILHIHQPSPTIPVLGTRFDASTVDEESVRAYRGKETAKTEMILQEYLSICLKKGVQAEKLCVEMDSIEKGIVETIYQQRIRKFVMGAAADKHYSMKMEDLKSKKANFVCQQAPVMCQIHFTCKGNLIHTREARVDEVRALSVLLSDFHRLVLPQISAGSLEEAARSSIDIKSSDILSYPGRSEVVLSDIQEEPNDSSSQVFPCSGMGLNMLNFLLNSTKIWQKLTIQNHEHCE